MDVRDHVRSYPYGSIARTIQYQGQTIGAFVSHHTWTYRGGQLLTGICIPGVSLVIQQQSTPTTGTSGLGQVQDSIASPDPSAAVYGADDVPQQAATTDWPMVGVTAGAILVLSTGFALALRHAGRRRR
jgi:hypothetical protein